MTNLIIKNQYRDHHCGELGIKQKSQQVKLAGWVHSRRDHGGLIFVDLRDFFGTTQVVFDPKNSTKTHKKAEQIRTQWCLAVQGTVRKRLTGMENPKLKTGQIELIVDDLTILSQAKTPPFEIKDKTQTSEELRLKYRYLDLRRRKMRDNLKFRAQVNLFTRNWFSNKDFLEVETPLLSAPAPEGARDFLVPARREPGKFFALPQSPQIFKQFLMYSAVDKYFQISPAFRDEDSRADRHVDVHYQLDLEMAFTTQQDIWEMYQQYLAELIKKFAPRKKLLKTPLPKFSHKQAQERFGSDKPDIRFGLELSDITKIAQKTDFNIFKQAEQINLLKVPKIRARAFELTGFDLKVFGQGDLVFSRKDLDDLTEIAKGAGAAGLAWTKIIKDNQPEGGIAKFLSPDLIKQMNAAQGDTLFFAADTRAQTAKILDIVRNQIAEKFSLKDPNLLAFCWINDFPIFEPVEEGAHGMSEQGSGVQFGHNPFTNPDCTLEELKKARQTGAPALLKIKARQFDLVCNGMEMFSGGERCVNPAMLHESFKAVGYSDKQVKRNFGPILEAFEYGPPPHSGLGQGMDRMLMTLNDETNVREMTAFPKTATCQDLMLNSPRPVAPAVLDELGLAIKEN
ncbi:MAG: aspartate--tRNA ligase [Candidatus Moranbacteria bacterium]|nr:aspartate--tRNA ligase [Candidatus Moranbacteria bacterium]